MKNIAFVFIVFVLVSSIFIHSINFAYASPVPNLIPSGETIHATIDGEIVNGNFIIEAGGKLIVDSGITLNINGGLLNSGEIIIDGVLFVNGIIINNVGGEIILRCGEFYVTGNTIDSGIIDDTVPCEDGSNIIEIINDIEIGVTLIIPSGDIGKISGDTTITISGTLVNNGDLENRGHIILDGGTIQNGLGTITNFCTNFDDKGIDAINGGKIFPLGNEVDDDVVCVGPTADDDNYVTDEDQQLTVSAPGVLDGDIDDGISLTTSLISSPILGGSVAMNNDGSFTYTPDDDFFGTYQFEYQVKDEDGGKDTATVTIEVTPVNDAPTAVNDPETGSIIVNEDSSVIISVLDNDTDPEEDTLSITSTTQSTIGTVTYDGTDVTYTPKPNLNGLDSFTYTISDGNGHIYCYSKYHCNRAK